MDRVVVDTPERAHSEDTPRGRLRPRRSSAGRLARASGLLGRVLVAFGVVMLFYTAYLLWGTNLYTQDAQRDLAREVASSPLVSRAEAASTRAVPPARPQAPPRPGDGLFTIVIPKLGLRTVVVQGVEQEELKKGPGHYPETPWPGEDGNVAIAGHRTTFGAPFYRLNELGPGDPITIESGPARYRYTVTEQLIVAPERTDVVENRGRNELTLTTCNPRFSAAQRLIIHARYDGAELVPPPSAQKAPAEATATPRTAPAEPELVPAPAPAIPRDVLLLAAVALACLLGAAGLSRRLRATAGWTAVVVSTGVTLWVAVFPQVLRLMPAQY